MGLHRNLRCKPLRLSLVHHTWSPFNPGSLLLFLLRHRVSRRVQDTARGEQHWLANAATPSAPHLSASPKAPSEGLLVEAESLVSPRLPWPLAYNMILALCF